MAAVCVSKEGQHPTSPTSPSGWQRGTPVDMEGDKAGGHPSAAPRFGWPEGADGAKPEFRMNGLHGDGAFIADMNAETSGDETLDDRSNTLAEYQHLRDHVRSVMPTVRHPWEVASVASTSICPSRGEAPSRSDIYLTPAARATSFPPSVVASADGPTNMAAEMFSLSPSPSRFLNQQAFAKDQAQTTEIFSMSPFPNAVLAQPKVMSTPKVVSERHQEEVNSPETKQDKPFGKLYSNSASPMTSSSPKLSARSRTRENGEPLEYFMLDYMGKRSSEPQRVSRTNQEVRSLQRHRRFSQSPIHSSPNVAASSLRWSSPCVLPTRSQSRIGGQSPSGRRSPRRMTSPNGRDLSNQRGIGVWQVVQAQQSMLASSNRHSMKPGSKCESTDVSGYDDDSIEAEMMRQFEGVRITCEERIAAFARRVQRMKTGSVIPREERMEAFSRRKQRTMTNLAELSRLEEAGDY
eukprot:TRINITY_DN15245_c0_g3_i1.p1 TRINITY_DN15245_c0_g3~~TRINITY_DN15245_c0_g3_i1.p1  ORF type:complete len:464 (+),score=58.08 TRINITY_DN15245_c0_g3_i1:130-1521(+)